MSIQVFLNTAHNGTTAGAGVGGFVLVTIGRVVVRKLWGFTYWGRRGAEKRAYRRAAGEDRRAQRQAASTASQHIHRL